MVPVFSEELDLLHTRLGLDGLPASTDFSLWASGTAYFQRGKKCITVSGITSGHPVAKAIRPTMRCGVSPEETRSLLWEANRSHLQRLEHEAIRFIHDVVNGTGRIPVVPFSGGKDSLAVSILARQIIAASDLLHVFADTGIEARDTHDFITEFQDRNPKVPFLRVVPNINFYQACELLGPPSRIKRWCCSTQKAFPLGALYSALGSQTPVLSLCGVRRAESVSRQKHERVLHSTKIADEIMISPIIDWSDAEVWAFILTKGVGVNRAYRRGYRRVGCMHCPHNSGWSEFLNSVYYPAQVSEWHDFVGSYYERHSNMPTTDASRRWKARAGGLSLSDVLAPVEMVQCQADPNAFSVTSPKGLPEELTEYLKPFGKVRVLRDDGLSLHAVIADSQTGIELVDLLGSRPRGHIRFSIHSGNRRLLRQRLTRQVKKSLACVRCGLCQVTCPSGAISCAVEYAIDEVRCTHCLRCVTEISGGCVAAHATNVTGGARRNGDNGTRTIQL